jgi:hypothetical protein
MRILTKILLQVTRLAAGCLAGLLFTGCSGQKNVPAGSGTAPKTTVSSQKTSGVMSTNRIARSVFTIDETSRDPFNPHAKRKTAATVAEAPPRQSVDFQGLLQAGFQGVVGSGERRIAIIHNVLFEPGRQATMSLGTGSGEQRVSVRCREVNRSSVVLEVQGCPQPIIVSRLPNL